MMKIKNFVLLFSICYYLGACTASSDDFNIVDFGAKPASDVVNTQAIQKAIDSAASRGGGKVTVPEGIYLTKAIRLKDNVELYLSEGAELKAPDQYTTNDGFIIADNVKNVKLTGKGTVNGNGKVRRLEVCDHVKYEPDSMHKYAVTHFWYEYEEGNRGAGRLFYGKTAQIY